MLVRCRQGLLAALVLAASGCVVATEDRIGPAAAEARRLARFAVPTKWQVPIEAAGSDLFEVLDGDRLAAGLLTPALEHGPLVLFDGGSGRELWRADRSHIPGGDYSLLPTERSLLLFGRGPGTLEVAAFDPRTGAPLWRHNVKDQCLTAISGARLFVLSLAHLEVLCLDLETGAKRWSQSVGDDLDPERPALLHLPERSPDGGRSRRCSWPDARSRISATSSDSHRSSWPSPL